MDLMVSVFILHGSRALDTLDIDGCRKVDTTLKKYENPILARASKSAEVRSYPTHHHHPTTTTTTILISNDPLP